MSESIQPPDVDIWMIHLDLQKTPKSPLPEGYRMRFYEEGDVEKWVEIQQASDPFFKATAETFASSMPGDAAFLSQRVMFLVDPTGRDIGSITAWENDDLTGEIIGQVHWVAIVNEMQGKGFAKPLLAAVCQRLIELGHKEACLMTNTRRLPAVNLYRKFGFEPLLQNEIEKEAWAKIASELKY